MDDIYCIIEKGSESAFLNHLNSIRPQIQFTMELPVDRTLAFLDCSLHKRNDGSLEINVHRKKTHTDRYLNFRSHHPSHVKKAVVQSLSDRAERIVNTKENLESERTHLNKVLVSNGYPESFINQATSRRAQKSASQQDDSSKHETMVVLPYVRGLSEELRRICGDYSIRVVFRSGPTLRSESEGSDTCREEINGCIPNPLQLWHGIYWRNSTKAGVACERTSGHLQKIPT